MKVFENNSNTLQPFQGQKVIGATFSSSFIPCVSVPWYCLGTQWERLSVPDLATRCLIMLSCQKCHVTWHGQENKQKHPHCWHCCWEHYSFTEWRKWENHACGREYTMPSLHKEQCMYFSICLVAVHWYIFIIIVFDGKSLTYTMTPKAACVLSLVSLTKLLL